MQTTSSSSVKLYKVTTQTYRQQYQVCALGSKSPMYYT
jgi:hypothetical protein